MKASLVYEGGSNLNIPESMGSPSPDQLEGTVAENLGELASRICYDSLGRGRSSVKLHQHILEVINLSVYEHFNFTIRCDMPGEYHLYIYQAVANRKGIWIQWNGGSTIDLTVNFRSILEWERHSKKTNRNMYSNHVYNLLLSYAKSLAPIIFKDSNFYVNDSPIKLRSHEILVKGLSEDQAWITLYLSGSRGWSHEQVRHRYAMSQRSTRYVDESESPYITHPIVNKYLNDTAISAVARVEVVTAIAESTSKDRETYRLLVERLESYLAARGENKQTARKQARGAARGYLGNALFTEMLYSAPVSGWKWIIENRLSPAADAEIRELYAEVLPLLKGGKYGFYFEEYTL